MSSILETTFFILATAAVIAASDLLRRVPKLKRERIVMIATLVSCAAVLAAIFAVPTVSSDCIGRRQHGLTNERSTPAVQMIGR